MAGRLWILTSSAKMLLQKNRKNVYFITRKGHYAHANVTINLRERGLFEDLFPENCGTEISEILNSQQQCIYGGFDPTASSLHVGNLLILKCLLHWQRSGHQVIALVGTATAQIGDPSDYFTDRELLDSNIIRQNAEKVKKNIETIFNNHETFFWNKLKDRKPLVPLKIVFNEDWYKNYNCLPFFNEVGRTFRMGTMLLKDSVRRRLNSGGGMTFREFGYQTLQAYDWYYLFNNYNCKFQVGGKDQMGNIVAGHNFISRFANGSVYGLTLPLITTEDGNKFGKSLGNAVWLDPQLTSPFDLYQFFFRTSDSKVEQYLKLFTFVRLNEINSLIQQHQKYPKERLAQKKLAEEVTLLVHGEKGLDLARKTTQVMYRNDITSLRTLNAADLSRVLADAPIVDMKLKPDYTVKDLLLDSGCFHSEVDAIQISGTGGLLINLKKTKNLNEVISESIHVLPNRTTIIGVGKKNCWIIRWN